MTSDLEYAEYPGGEHFEPWQDHEWPLHCKLPAQYRGEIGLGEVELLSTGAVDDFLVRHGVYGGDPPITRDMIPPHAPNPGENWSQTLHHFRCQTCGWDLLLRDAN